MKGRSHRLQNSDPPDDWVDGSWTVDCVCGVNFDDGEEMVNCDECGVWVHTRCSRYVKGDELFTCDKCKSKNNRNDSEETEVAQLLVEMPTKTLRMESSYAGHVQPHSCRLWTQMSMEKRAHVQGIPGGDPELFGGLSSVFTPDLWKCTGYVPKKFNFQYREFPCWDEKKEGDDKIEDENENPVDKGAGVLFSLSKESVVATTVGALTGMRGRDEEGGCDRKAYSKEMKRWKGEDADARHGQNGEKETDVDARQARHVLNGAKERSSFGPAVIHSGKQKKEDLGTSKDRSGKKKIRDAEKETDVKKRGGHVPKTVFTSTSDAKQLEFYGGRGQKYSKNEIRRIRSGNLRDTLPPVSDGYLAVDSNNVEKAKNNLEAIEYRSDAFCSDVSRHNISNGTGLKGDKLDHQVPAGLENSSKTDGVKTLLSDYNDSGSIPIKEEGDSAAVNCLDGSVEGYCQSIVKPPLEDFTAAPLDVKDNQNLPDLTDEIPLTSVQLNDNVKAENNNFKGVSHLQCSPTGDAKNSEISSDNKSGNPKVKDEVVSGSQFSDRKAQDVDRSSIISNHVTDKANDMSIDPGWITRESVCSEGSVALQKGPSEAKHDLVLPEEQSKSIGTVLTPLALHNQRKVVVCVGKSSSNSSSGEIFKSSSSSDLKPPDNQGPDPITLQQVISDYKVNIRKDRASTDEVRDEDTHETSRKTVKEHSKSTVDSALKISHSSRISHSSISKRTASDSKDSVISSSSKAPSVLNIAVTLDACEPTGSQQNQNSLHIQNKILASGLPQRGEKFNQPNFQSSPKVNHTPLVQPPATSSSPAAALSDEELALLLHQELNSSPRVPRVPRVRHAGSLPQLASPTGTTIPVKRTSSSGGKDHTLVPRRKGKDASKGGFHSSREFEDESKKRRRVPPSPDQIRQDLAYTADASTKREDNGSPAGALAIKKNIPLAPTATANSGPSSSTEVNEHNTSSMRNSPLNASDDDAGTAAGPVHRTLPGLINEIMSKGRRMTYEELCNAVLPHWHNLRKHNGERYAYSTPSQAVLDCLRNRHEWARLVDRGPKTNPSRRKRKFDAEPPNAESEDNEYGKGRNAKDVESKSLESQREEFPKGKRKARKRRRLALQGRGIKEVRNRRKADLLSDDDSGPFSNSSDGSMFSQDEIRGDATSLAGSEASASSDETGSM